MAADAGNKAKSRFLARMSHELRTPISAIMGISEMQLRGSQLSPGVEDGLAKVYDSSKLLLNIVNDILDLSRIEAGKMSLVTAKYDVASFVEDVAQVNMLYAERNVIFEVHVDENLPAYLYGDVLRIRQIVSNLLTNAFKYTEEGEIRLEVRWDEGLVITVSDTGVGMTAQQTAEVENDYVRAHETELPLVSGTGLGLSIVYSLAEMMGAEVDMVSAVGSGTTVTVRVPQKRASDEALGADVASALMSFRNGSWKRTADMDFVLPQLQGRVLVVDDVDTNLYVAESMLEAFGLEVELVDSGYEAINRAKAGNVYDVIFMDHMMPGMDGLVTMRQLREMEYAAPIVALTANALKGQAELMIDAGFSGFMAKPIDIKLLSANLLRFVGK
jgi:CheY-like chemotaxis protein/two-component sensor histidine kinase